MDDGFYAQVYKSATVTLQRPLNVVIATDGVRDGLTITSLCARYARSQDRKMPRLLFRIQFRRTLRDMLLLYIQVLPIVFCSRTIRSRSLSKQFTSRIANDVGQAINSRTADVATNVFSLERFNEQAIPQLGAELVAHPRYAGHRHRRNPFLVLERRHELGKLVPRERTSEPRRPYTLGPRHFPNLGRLLSLTSDGGFCIRIRHEPYILYCTRCVPRLSLAEELQILEGFSRYVADALKLKPYVIIVR